MITTTTKLLTAAARIAHHMGVAIASIKAIRVFDNALWVVIKGKRPLFISKAVLGAATDRNRLRRIAALVNRIHINLTAGVTVDGDWAVFQADTSQLNRRDWGKAVTHLNRRGIPATVVDGAVRVWLTALL